MEISLNQICRLENINIHILAYVSHVRVINFDCQNCSTSNVTTSPVATRSYTYCRPHGFVLRHASQNIMFCSSLLQLATIHSVGLLLKQHDHEASLFTPNIPYPHE